MANPKIPLNELAVAVESAVQQALAKKGFGPIDHIWVGFVAPDKLATIENAQIAATALAHESGVAVHASSAQVTAAPVAAGAVHTAALPNPQHILGFIYSPKTPASKT